MLRHCWVGFEVGVDVGVNVGDDVGGSVQCAGRVSEAVQDAQDVDTNFSPARLDSPSRLGYESVDDEAIIALATC
jgi:hypothetical protein